MISWSNKEESTLLVTRSLVTDNRPGSVRRLCFDGLRMKVTETNAEVSPVGARQIFIFENL